MVETKAEHIKNFFVFLKQKENREIPAVIKYLHFPDDVTEDDINLIKFNKDDKNNDDLSYIRGLIYNEEQNRFRFVHIHEFNKRFDGLAVAFTQGNQNDAGYYAFYINFKGEPSIEGIPNISKEFSTFNLSLNTITLIVEEENNIQELKKLYNIVIDTEIKHFPAFQEELGVTKRYNLLNKIREKIDRIKRESEYER